MREFIPWGFFFFFFCVVVRCFALFFLIFNFLHLLVRVLQVLICRNYRGDVDMSEIEHFMTLLMDKEEEGTLSPILAHGGVRFMWIKHNNLYRILLTLGLDLGI